MAILRETILTTLPVDEAFAFVADFANAERWDPGVAYSRRADAGDRADRRADCPIGVGTAYELGVRMAGRIAPMVYRVTTWDPPRRVVLTGQGSGVEAVDDIRFEPTDSGARIEYAADIRLRGWLRLLSPFAGGAFASIAANARSGMQRALDDRSAGRPAVAA